MEEMEKVLAYKPGRWRWWLAGVMVLLLFAGSLFIYFKPSDTQSSYRFVTRPVVSDELNITVSASGYLKPQESVVVGTEVSGTIETVAVDYNDAVKQGALLARLDKTKYQSSVDQMRAALDAAKATLENAESALFRADAKVKRNRQLRETTKGKLPAPNEWDNDWAAYLAAKAQVHNAQAMLEQAKYNLQTAQYNLERTDILSPVDGIVLKRNVDPGQTVVASFQTPVLFALAKDLRNMELQLSVDEADIARVHAGQPVAFQVDAYPDTTFTGLIKMVRVDSQIEDGVVTYIAELDVNNSDLRLRPGMSADADITVKTFSHVLIVPRAALLYVPAKPQQTKMFAFGSKEERPFDAQTHVWRLRGDRQEKIYVKVLGSNGTRSAISSDELREGDAVIVAQEKRQ